MYQKTAKIQALYRGKVARKVSLKRLNARTVI